MSERDLLLVPEELAASLRRVVNDHKPETVYDAQGSPIVILVPAVKTSTPAAREQFLQLLRSWRDGDPEEQRYEWEQLEEVLAEEGLSEQPA